MRQTKKGIRLILGLSLPVLMVLMIVISLYLPSFFVRPHFNFLYLIDNTNQDLGIDNTSQSLGSVAAYFQNDALFETPEDLAHSLEANPYQKLYMYDVQKKQSIEVSSERVGTLIFEQNLISPDGYQIVCGEDRRRLSSPNNYYRGCYGGNLSVFIVKSNYAFKKISGSPQNDMSHNFKFVAWV